MNCMYRTLLATVALAFSSVTASASTITVCASGCDYTTIQDAIDAASLGDTISIEGGTYYESLVISGEAINLESANGKPVIVDGSGTDRCLNITGTQQNPMTVRGITFQNGIATDEGAGVRINAADVTLISCVVRQNLCDRDIGCAWCTDNRVRGGGVAVLGSSTVTIQETSISENQVRISFYAWGANGQSRGGGLYVEDSIVQVDDCTFSSNEAIARDYPPNCANCNHPATAVGAGICVASGGDVTITDTIIEDGRLYGENASYGFGAGVACMGGSAVLQNCVIRGNASIIPDNCYCGPEKNQGGGIYIGESGLLSLVSTTIEENIVANSSTNEGGAIHNEDGTLDIQSSVICGNTSSQITGTYTNSGGNCIEDIICCPAETITVCGSGCDYTTIQDAIDAASLGDTISIEGGTYYESLVISGEAINLESANGKPVIVDGSGTDRCLNITGTQQNPMTVRGITFQNGIATDEGAGVRINAADVTLISCVVRQNLCDRDIGCAWCTDNRVRGGGVAVLGSSTVTIQETSISENQVRISFYAWGANGQSRGGGLYVEDSIVQVDDCTFSSNEAIARDYPPNCANCNHPATAVGAGICVASGGDVTITDTIIEDGRLYGENASYGFGAGVACMGGSAVLQNCVIRGNASIIPDNCYCGPEKNQGGGIYIGESGLLSLVSTTIEENIVANSSTNEGGAIHNEDGTLDIQSSVICGNTSSQITGTYTNSGGNCIEADCCPGDIDCNGLVDAVDLGRILMAWGSFDAVVDQNSDGLVRGADLAYILSYWGASCD